MISLYIGIDPSINSTGICIQAYRDDEELFVKFYIVHGGKLKKKEIIAEEYFSDIFQYVQYEKIDTREFKNKDNHKFELAKTKNLVSIAKSIDSIVLAVERVLSYDYPMDDIEKYVTIESNSFNSRQNSVSLIELCGLNYLIRSIYFDKPGTTLIIVTPSEIKKYATSKGNADKDLIELVFKTKYSDLVESDIKTDDIADAYFMSNYSREVSFGSKSDFVKDNELTNLVKEVFEKKKIKQKQERVKAKFEKQSEIADKNKISEVLLNSI